ncbi:MAG: DnaJ C-terminal domain-containing protein [Desulfovibrionaceae bacterium]
MGVEYKDYYKILGVARTASSDEISKAYKKLARKHHPDLNPGDPKAEERFKELNEAHEVLKDAEKRKMYDQLGPNWQHGQNFQRPPGFGGASYHFGGGGGFDAGGFSDFFEAMFGGGGGGFAGGGFGGRAGGFQQQGRRPRRGADSEATLELTLEEAYHGGRRHLTVQEHVAGASGLPEARTKTLDVNIPAGIKDGAKIRLSGQGNPGAGGGAAGDLYLKVVILPHSRFYLDGVNIIIDLPLAPWEAVLGAKIQVPTLDGPVDMAIPAGADSGKKLRLRGRGLGQGSQKGDLLVRLRIKAPEALSDEERALWEELAAASTFNPRNG